MSSPLPVDIWTNCPASTCMCLSRVANQTPQFCPVFVPNSGILKYLSNLFIFDGANFQCMPSVPICNPVSIDWNRSDFDWASTLLRLGRPFSVIHSNRKSKIITNFKYRNIQLKAVKYFVEQHEESTGTKIPHDNDIVHIIAVAHVGREVCFEYIFSLAKIAKHKYDQNEMNERINEA